MKQVRSLLVILAGLSAPIIAEPISSRRCSLQGLGLSLGTISSLTANPSTISFTAANPNGGAVSGSASASISWRLLGGSHLRTWGTTVHASDTSFTGCPTVPVSAVTAACVSATVDGRFGTGSCGGSFALSTVATQLAGGLEGDGVQSYSVLVQYTLAESWRYVANPSCQLTLTYTVTAP